ncbi:MAG TPA: aldehyde dehydrogenase family protein [Casimicrobiaceae bacterium]|nr:aldehyde dehydrogenase family protein [Casimicrobiaceae bacterium]
MSIDQVRLVINGQQLEGDSTIDLHEPYRGVANLRVHIAGERHVDQAVDAAHAAFRDFGRQPMHVRAAILAKVAKEVAANKAAFVEALIAATGKTRKDASGEVDRSLETLSISSEEALRIEGFEVPMDASPRGKGRIAIARRYPIGVVGAITPFNAPLNTVCHKIAPAIAAGNTVVLKPDLRGARVAAMLVEAFHRAGMPVGGLNLIHGDAPVGERLVVHPKVEVVGFTGSETTGARITALAGLKRVLLELGGNAPAIIHEDADIAAAVKDLVPASFGLSGQSCISTQRIYAHSRIYETFVAQVIQAAKALKVGDPSLPDTDIGPMVTEDAARRVESWIREAERSGARIECGGGRQGAIVQPTVITGATHEMTVVCKEVFGPVVSIFGYDDIDDVIERANSTPYGLQAGVYTKSLDLALRAGTQLRFGGVIINGPSRWRLDHMPYGGVKRSGVGREGPRYAIEDMSELRMLVLG